jgi:hypothetical protein
MFVLNCLKHYAVKNTQSVKSEIQVCLTLFTISPQNQIRWTGSDPASAVPLFADPVLDCPLASRSGIANVSSYRCGYEVFGFGSAEVVADHQTVLP